jgi:hypothetical protein
MRAPTRALAASIAAVLLAAGCGGARSPEPGASPGAAAGESPRLPDGAIGAASSVDPGAFAAPSPSPSPSAAAAGAPSAAEAAASPSPSPTADPEAAKRAEQEQALRARADAARAKSEAATAEFNAECPELKPGELRHPGAVAHCNHLHDDAAAALQAYEAAKRDAQAAGVTVQ